MGKYRIRQDFEDKFDTERKTGIEVSDHETPLGERDQTPVLAFRARDDDGVAIPWLDRGQVQDLVVVLGYWLKQTEGEDEGNA